MSSRRTAKVAEAIRETVSTTILFGLKDPRVKHVTVIRAEVSPDIRSAKVYVSVMGDEKVQSLTMRGLDSARGFLQAKVADRLQTRYTPILKFVLDPGVKLSAEASAVIRDVLGDASSGGAGEGSAGGDAGSAGREMEDAGWDEDAGEGGEEASDDRQRDDDGPPDPEADARQEGDSSRIPPDLDRADA